MTSDTNIGGHHMAFCRRAIDCPGGIVRDYRRPQIDALVRQMIDRPQWQARIITTTITTVAGGIRIEPYITGFIAPYILFKSGPTDERVAICTLG